MNGPSCIIGLKYLKRSLLLKPDCPNSVFNAPAQLDNGILILIIMSVDLIRYESLNPLIKVLKIF